MKNSKKGFFVPLFITIFVVLATGVGIYFYENKKVDAPTPTRDVSTQSTKSYSNTEQGFRFEYPTSWSIKLDQKVEAGEYYDQGIVYVIGLLDSNNNSSDGGVTDGLTITKVKTSCTSTDWVEESGNYIASRGSTDKFLKKNRCIGNNISVAMYVRQDGSTTEPKEIEEKIVDSIQRF